MNKIYWLEKWKERKCAKIPLKICKKIDKLFSCQKCIYYHNTTIILDEEYPI